MRIAIAAERIEQCEHAVEVLREQGNTVEVLDYERAAEELRARPPHAVFAWLPNCDAASAVRTLCTADATRTTYLIGVVPADRPDRAMSSALAAGCHDVLQAPFTDEELLARLTVLGRVRDLLAAHAALVEENRPVVERTRTWHFLGDVVADDLEQMVGRQITVTRRGASGTPSIRAASIMMALASDRVELQIALAADPTACRWLAENLLGDAAAAGEDLDDVLREMANVAGGAVKRAILPEGLVLTIGLPVGGETAAAPGKASETVRSWSFALDDGVALTVAADVRARPHRRVPANSLVEGMVLVEDVRTDGGVVPAGTRLTTTTVERLARQLERELIDISPLS